MAVYQTRPFVRFARKAGLSAEMLVRAASEVAEGRYEADLGGGVYKKRIARVGGGKSGGFRTILFFGRGEHIFFAEGFAKNEKANVTQRELEALKQLANLYLNLSDEKLALARRQGALVELESGNGDAKNIDET